MRAFGGVVVGSSCPGPRLEDEEEESSPRIRDFDFRHGDLYTESKFRFNGLLLYSTQH